MTGLIGIAKGSVGVINEVLKTAGDNPEVRAAGGELGKTALTITKAINNALLPLAAINFAFEKAKDYFASRFQIELSAKLEAVPPEQVIEPRPSVAGPALQGLAFSHEEPDLKELYLNLLVSAMDGRVSGDVHPAFVEIIRQLTAEEAKLLRTVLRAEGDLPIVELRVSMEPSGWITACRHLLRFESIETGVPVEEPRIPATVDNWIRLGLVTVEYDKYLVDESLYAWVESRPEVTRLRAEHDRKEPRVTILKGVLARTALGQQFGMAVGILDKA